MKTRETNIFDNLPRLVGPSKSALQDELDAYLAQPVEYVDDPLVWWTLKKIIWPNLSRMALDYLLILATSTDVERVFSHGRVLLTHTHNRLSAQMLRALMCLGEWSLMGLINDSDICAVAKLPDIEVEVRAEVEDGWEDGLTSLSGGE